MVDDVVSVVVDVVGFVDVVDGSVVVGSPRAVVVDGMVVAGSDVVDVVSGVGFGADSAIIHGRAAVKMHMSMRGR